MNRVRFLLKITLAVNFTLAMAFTFSCSDDNIEDIPSYSSSEMGLSSSYLSSSSIESLSSSSVEVRPLTPYEEQKKAYIMGLVNVNHTFEKEPYLYSASESRNLLKSLQAQRCEAFWELPRQIESCGFISGTKPTEECIESNGFYEYISNMNNYDFMLNTDPETGIYVKDDGTPMHMLEGAVMVTQSQLDGFWNSCTAWTNVRRAYNTDEIPFTCDANPVMCEDQEEVEQNQ